MDEAAASEIAAHILGEPQAAPEAGSPLGEASPNDEDDGDDGTAGVLVPD
jgi:hypothetical protein